MSQKAEKTKTRIYLGFQEISGGGKKKKTSKEENQ